MPNWCNNKLVIVHKDEGKLKSLYETIKKYDESELDEKPAFFGKILPEPNYDEVEVLPTFPEIVGMHSVSDWPSLDWRVQNWGTKWEPSIISLSYKRGTEWCEPTKERMLEKSIRDGLFGGNKERAEKSMMRQQIILDFDTAWGPPKEVIHALVEQGFRTNHVHMEGGMGDFGWIESGKELASGNIFDYLCDSLGLTYSQWKKQLPNGDYSSEWKIDVERSRKKAFANDITEEIWEHVGLDNMLHFHAENTEHVKQKRDGRKHHGPCPMVEQSLLWPIIQ